MKPDGKSKAQLIGELPECVSCIRQLEIASRVAHSEEEVKRLELLIQERTTELSRATEALKLEAGERRLADEARSQLTAIIEYSEDAIVGKTLDGVVTSWNAAAQKMFGFSAKEAVGRPITMIFPPELVDEERFILETVRELGLVENYETVRLRKDGTRIDVSVTVTPVRDLEGKIIGLSSIKRNITRRKQIEAALNVYMERLEKTNEALQEFTSVASHDLKEPLRKIQALGDLLGTRYDGVLDREGRLHLERMKNAANRMQQLIDCLLSYAQVSAKTSLFLKTDLKALAHEALADLDVRIQETRGQVEIGDLPVIDADPGQIRQLFQNLIGNALKYHGEQSPLVRISSPPPRNGYCQIIIEDNGIGFNEEYLDLIFKPFQRLHGRSKYEGAGMGLAICKRIVERHGGTITATSQPGAGSTFIVSLPLHQIYQPEKMTA